MAVTDPVTTYYFNQELLINCLKLAALNWADTGTLLIGSLIGIRIFKHSPCDRDQGAITRPRATAVLVNYRQLPRYVLNKC